MPMLTLSETDNPAYEDDDDLMVQIAVPEVMVELNEAELLEDTE